jgi:hypothetical protein
MSPFLFLHHHQNIIIVKDTTKGNVFVRTYKSLLEFFGHSDRTDSQEFLKENVHSYNIKKHLQDKSSDDVWTFGQDINLATFKTARLNPKFGRDLCRDEISKQTRSKEYQNLMKMALTYRKKLKLVDMGGRISVPHAVAGDDKFFIQTKSASRPTVKIGINMCVSAMVSTDDLVKIAQKAVPTIYLLESGGIATEVWLCTFTSNTYDNSMQRYSLTEVLIKSAQERFNWTTFAPVFCPGTYRYNFFRSWAMNTRETAYGLGSPMIESEIELVSSEHGYTCVIGNNKVGSFDIVKEVFSKIS